jgi:hypothetical protein
MVALGEGAQQQVEAQIQRMGTDVLTIRPAQAAFGGWPPERTRASSPRTPRRWWRTRAGLVIAPEISQRLQVTSARYNTNSEILGTWPTYFDIYNMPLAFGRSFEWGEVEGAPGCRGGLEIPDRLNTPAALLVGRTIQIGARPSRWWACSRRRARWGSSARTRWSSFRCPRPSTGSSGAGTGSAPSWPRWSGPAEIMDRAYDVIDATSAASTGFRRAVPPTSRSGTRPTCWPRSPRPTGPSPSSWRGSRRSRSWWAGSGS